MIDESARTIRRDWSRIPVAHTRRRPGARDRPRAWILLTPAMLSGTVLAAFATVQPRHNKALVEFVDQREKELAGS